MQTTAATPPSGGGVVHVERERRAQIRQRRVARTRSASVARSVVVGLARLPRQRRQRAREVLGVLARAARDLEHERPSAAARAQAPPRSAACCARRPGSPATAGKLPRVLTAPRPRQRARRSGCCASRDCLRGTRTRRCAACDRLAPAASSTSTAAPTSSRSSNVTVHSTVSAAVRVKRSIILTFSLERCGAVSARKFVVSTTSVSPSHQPRASPKYCFRLRAMCGRRSSGITRASWIIS